MMSALTENGAASHIEELSPKPETFLRITTDVGRRLTWSSGCISISMKRKGLSFGPRHWRQRAQATPCQGGVVRMRKVKSQAA